MNLLWAAHVVHHQSEDYNLAVALRQAVLTSFTALPFYAAARAPRRAAARLRRPSTRSSTLYQFWIHTELVGKLGCARVRSSTRRAHHRVHHAINPQYLDKNYGADRSSSGTGSSAPSPRRASACVYGVVKPLASFNPLWAQVQPLVALAAASVGGAAPARQAPDLARPAGVDAPGRPACPPGVADGSYVRRPKYDPRAPRPVQRYATAQFAIAVVTTAALMFMRGGVPAPPRRGRRAGRAHPGDERRPPRAPALGPRLEIARLALVAAGAAAWARGGALFVPIVLAAGAYALGSALWLRRAGAGALDPAAVIRAR